MRWTRRRNDGDRAFAHLVGGERGDEREPAAALLARAARVGLGAAPGARAAPPRRTLRGASSSSASSASGARRGFAARRGLAAEALLGDLVGLALGFFVVLAALVFVALARFGGFALGRVDLLRGCCADARLFLGDLALLGLAQAGVGERVGAARSALRRSGCAARRRTAWASGAAVPGAGAADGAAAGDLAVRCRAWHGAASGGRRRFGLGLAGTGAAL